MTADQTKLLLLAYPQQNCMPLLRNKACSLGIAAHRSSKDKCTRSYAECESFRQHKHARRSGLEQRSRTESHRSLRIPCSGTLVQKQFAGISTQHAETAARMSFWSHHERHTWSAAARSRCKRMTVHGRDHLLRAAQSHALCLKRYSSSITVTSQ
eukprot:3027246-Pleurochrysis_carterae.AAC.1